MKNHSESKLGVEVVNAIKSRDLQDVGGALAETGLDAFLDAGVARDIPIVGALVGLIRVGASVRDAVLAQKLTRFISVLSGLRQEERTAMIEKLESEASFRGRVGEQVLEIIERVGSVGKPELLAKVFIALAKGTIQPLDFHRLVLAIDRLPMHELSVVRKIANATNEDLLRMDRQALHALSLAGFTVNNGGFDGGVYVPTDTTKLFLRLDLDL